nr:MAG TPA: hypothetical protein [Caudoviricetes sp.]
MIQKAVSMVYFSNNELNPDVWLSSNLNNIITLYVL